MLPFASPVPLLFLYTVEMSCCCHDLVCKIPDSAVHSYLNHVHILTIKGFCCFLLCTQFTLAKKLKQYIIIYKNKV